MENPEVNAAMATPDAIPSPTVEGSQEEDEQQEPEGLEEGQGSASKTDTDQRGSVTSVDSQDQEKEQEQEQDQDQDHDKDQDQDQDQEQEQKQEQEEEQGQDEDQESIISSLLSDRDRESDFPRIAKRVRAFVRVKPTAQFAQDMIKFGSDNKSIDIHIPKRAKGGVVNNTQTDWSFKLDGLLHDSSQELVYNTVAKDLVSKSLQGYNGTIMCYGQTGAGKTYTMTGATSEYKHRGIIPRAIQQIFKAAAEFLNVLVTVRISYLEIYNEALFDLLAPGPARGSRDTPLAIRDGPRGVYVKGLSVHHVSHEEEALNLLFEGETNRVIAEHSLNKNSSRSHCIFTMYIECRSRDYKNLKCLRSKITLIDLAGSERLSKTGSEGQVRVEASYINKSLSFLEQLVIALADPKREHIPFRQSKLTHVLKDSLGGNCYTVLVTNICGEAVHVDETLSSLRFATRMNWVTAEPVPNERIYHEVSVKALEEEIRLLRRELIMQDCLANRSVVTYGPLTAAQRADIRSQVQKYLRGVIEEIDIVNVRQIQEVFRQFKVAVSQQEEEAESRLRSKRRPRDRDDLAAESESDSASGSASGSDLDSEEEEDELGHRECVVDRDEDLEQEEDEESLETGSPPTSPVPRGKKEAKKGDERPLKDRLRSPPPGTGLADSSASKSPTKDLDEEEEENDEDSTDSDEDSSGSSPEEDSQQTSSPPPKAEAFEMFKRQAGREIHRIFRENKSILLARKRRSNSVARRVNLTKERIEAIKATLEAEEEKRRHGGEYRDEKGERIIDEKELSFLVGLKELKEQYRVNFAELQELRTEIQYCQRLVDKCRKRLLSEFEIWYNESFLIPKHLREALKPSGNIRPGMIPINRVTCLDEDEQDRFERMQETALPECPGSVSFYRARMKTDQKHTFDKTMASLRKMHKKPGLVTASGKKKPPSSLPIT